MSGLRCEVRPATVPDLRSGGLPPDTAETSIRILLTPSRGPAGGQGGVRGMAPSAFGRGASYASWRFALTSSTGWLLHQSAHRGDTCVAQRLRAGARVGVRAWSGWRVARVVRDGPASTRDESCTVTSTQVTVDACRKAIDIRARSILSGSRPFLLQGRAAPIGSGPVTLLCSPVTYFCQPIALVGSGQQGGEGGLAMVEALLAHGRHVVPKVRSAVSCVRVPFARIDRRLTVPDRDVDDALVGC